MATTCGYSRLAMFGMPQPTLMTTLADSTSCNVSGAILAKITMPATSVSDGMTCDVSADLQTKCYGGDIIARTVGKTVAYDFEVVPTSTFTSSQLKIRARRCSTGALLTAATDLSGETLIAMLYGY